MQHVSLPPILFRYLAYSSGSLKLRLLTALVMLLLLGTGSFSFGQNTSATPPAPPARPGEPSLPGLPPRPGDRLGGGPNKPKEEWKLLKTVENVKFYYQNSECRGRPMLLLKIENGNSNAVEGNWQLTVQEGARKVQYAGGLAGLQAGASRSGSCQELEPALAILHPFNRSKGASFALEAKVRRR